MRVAVFVLCVMALAAPAAANPRLPVYAPSAAAQAKPLAPPQRLERHFLQVSAGNLRFQADASRLAETRSSQAAVREVAAMLLARQEQVQPDMLRLLHARGMAPPMMSPEHDKLLKRLARLSGPAFDRLYVDEVVLRSLRIDIANHEKMVDAAVDPVLRTWAGRQLVALRMHAALAARTLPPALRAQRGA